MMNYVRNSVRCLALRVYWKILLDQAGSLYLLTGRMMYFSLEMTHGSKKFRETF
ncbi:hypothetical protein GW17_00020206 [Ensete ventricosum]|nr:hypothetical protein GW17_00020206 [Ensete ventricosum]